MTVRIFAQPQIFTILTPFPAFQLAYPNDDHQIKRVVHATERNEERRDAMFDEIPEESMPGAGFDFQDAYSIFQDAAADMDPGSFFLSEHMSLMDAMAAFEIGEPRLDSGIETEEDRRPPFDPLAPLLPEEICWIMDRALSYEMEWHAGNLLTHSVFTLQYIHHLTYLDQDMIPLGYMDDDDPSRPLELLTVVLRAYVTGLLKSCDLSWRELAKGGVLDAEDWQGDKCDVSLLEGVQTKHALSLLEQAEIWLSGPNIPDAWREPLLARVRLRKIFLQLLHAEAYDAAGLQQLATMGSHQLMLVRAFPSTEPDASSPALLGFDPKIGRHLKTFIPLRVITLPPLEQTFTALEGFFTGWNEFSVLGVAHSLTTWDLVGNLRNWMPNPPIRAPYLRSYAQSVFYDGLLILNKFNFPWLVQRFFFETLGVSYDSLVQLTKAYLGESSTAFSQVDKIINKMMTPYIRGHWLNPPRRRRHLANSLFDWHRLYDALFEIVLQLEDAPIPKDHIFFHIPKAALLWRLSSIREIIFSGFQLELLAKEERPIAYWFAAKVIDQHLELLDDLMPLVEKRTATYQEMQFQFQLLTALQALLLACFTASMSCISFKFTQMQLNFYRRYKWMTRPEYEDFVVEPVGHPDLEDLLPDVQELLEDESFKYVSPAEMVDMAEMLLSGLTRSGNIGGWAGAWGEDRMKMLEGLVNACKGLKGIPTSVRSMDGENWDVSQLEWDIKHHPWFPRFTVSSGKGKEKSGRQ